MHEDIRAHFRDLEEAVRATGIPAERQEVMAGSVRRLSDLYTKFRETNESRYGDAIAALIQGLLMDLEACPEARKLDAAFREKLHRLHEELGVPRLVLKPAPKPRAPKKPRKQK